MRSVSKRLRFEIFKRDSFTCQYCGRKPPEVRLEVDHIHPVAAGGADEDLNLLTACDECNAGKSDIPLDEIPAKPDALEAYYRAQQELREAEYYLETLRALQITRERLINELQNYWQKTVRKGMPSDKHIRAWLHSVSPMELVEAFDIVADVNGSCPDRFSNIVDLFRYVGGILRNRRKHEQSPAE